MRCGWSVWLRNWAWGSAPSVSRIRKQRALGEVAVVLNCAGPFLYTSAPMVDACLRTGTHYLDLTGPRVRDQDPDDRFRPGAGGGDQGDLGRCFTAYHSTGIPDIEDYAVLPKAIRWPMAAIGCIRPLFRVAALRKVLNRVVKPGSTAPERARTLTHVWGEVEDGQGQRAVPRMHGPEAGVIWRTQAALAAVRNVLAGKVSPGFQTPARAFGADFVLECEGVNREDLN